jgi:hypothetical protein
MVSSSSGPFPGGLVSRIGELWTNNPLTKPNIVGERRTTSVQQELFLLLERRYDYGFTTSYSNYQGIKPVGPGIMMKYV